MTVLKLTGLRKSLGSVEVLRGVDLSIARGDKLGCVGRNGAGKTTLLRLIEGDEAPDSGTIQLERGARIGHVEQRPEFAPGLSLRAFAEEGLAEVHAVEAELEALSHRMERAAGSELEALTRRHGELGARMEFLGGWESERRVSTVLSGIGLAPELWHREARTLSGGEKSRASLARVLVSVPDLLLLDEPTNHLDLSGIEWLEDFLRTLASAVLIVSHDRRLLTQLVDSIVEIERGTLTRYPGNYPRYLELKAERHASELRAWEVQQDEIRREELFIRTHMGSQRTGEAKGRQKKLDNLVRLPRPHLDVRRPVIRMGAVERGGEQVVEAVELELGYGDRPLLAGVNLRIARGERVGIVGPNGQGKSTLLRALAGRLAPRAGSIVRGHRAVCGYFDQELSDLDEEGTPYLELRRAHPLLTDLEVRSHLARFLFRGDEVDLAVRVLSGGERARLSLAKLVLSSPSWLALDEPTNHLDLAGRTALEELLGEFPGALVFVSHDREFLDGLATRIVEVRGGRVRSFAGNYSDHHRVLEEERQRERADRDTARTRQRERRAPTPATGQGRGAGKPRNPWSFRKLEEAIIALEGERAELLASLGEERVYRDAAAMREMQTRLAELERELQEKNAEWERSIQ